jgi:hypothetical protein
MERDAGTSAPGSLETDGLCTNSRLHCFVSGDGF